MKVRDEQLRVDECDSRASRAPRALLEPHCEECNCTKSSSSSTFYEYKNDIRDVGNTADLVKYQTFFGFLASPDAQ